MLSVKQLKDIAKCGEIKDCKQCSAFRYCVDEFDLCKALAETALVYREMLEQLEWIEDENGRLYCPVCNMYKRTYGHTPDCELAALLKESEVEQDG